MQLRATFFKVAPEASLLADRRDLDEWPGTSIVRLSGMTTDIAARSTRRGGEDRLGLALLPPERFPRE